MPDRRTTNTPRYGLLIALVGTPACFSDTEPGTGQTGSANTTDMGTSTGSPTTTSGSTSSDTPTESSSETSSSSGAPCVVGSLACACRPDPAPPCGLQASCADGICVPVQNAPDACVVSHGGGPDPVGFAVTRVHADGEIGDTTLSSVRGAAHEVGDEVGGQEMLVACNGLLYAVLEGTGEVQPLRLTADDQLQPLAATTVLDPFGVQRESLRGVVCAPEIDRLIAIGGNQRTSALGDIVVQALLFNPDGTLALDGAPTLSAFGTGDGPFESIRATWVAASESVIVSMDRPETSSIIGITARQFTIVPGGGHTEAETLGVLLLTRRVGGIAVDPRSEFLAIAGSLLQDSTGSGGRFALDQNGIIVNPIVVADDTITADAWASVSSLRFVEHGIGVVYAAMAGDGQVVFADFSETPTEVARFDTLGSGSTALMLAHDGTVLITATARRVTTYDFTPEIELVGATETETQPRVLLGHSASVVVPCADRP